MNSKKSYAILSLISECMPEDQDLYQKSMVEEIISMPEYLEIKNRKAFSSVFFKYYTYDTLKKMSISALKSAKNAVKILPEVITELSYCVKNGYGSKLTSNDKPDFYSDESLINLINKIKNCTDKNHSNIASENLLALFETTTIRSPNELVKKLPYMHTDNIQEELNKILKDQCYCISADGTNDIIASIKENITEKENRIRLNNLNIFKFKLIKISIILALLFVPVILLFFGFIQLIHLISLELIILVLAIFYWIWG